MSENLGMLLVVDDEEMNRDMLSRRLELEGYATVQAASGAEALELISQQPFDAVLLDVKMPEQNGYEVLTEIRRTHSNVELPVLMVTAKGQNDDVVTAFELGANDHLTTPINFPVALARIRSHVASKHLCSQLQDSKTRYSLSAQGANDGLWDWDLRADCVYYSERWKTMLGYQDGDIGDSPDEWFGRIHPDDLSHVQEELQAHRDGQTEQFESEHRMQHQDGTHRWVLTRGVAIRDAAGREIRMAGSQTDITRGKAADSLTGLANRVLFRDRLDTALENARQQPGFRFAVLFLDIDRFKLVNDSLGHHAGDELLVAIARRLGNCMRKSDVVARISDQCTVARFGGDEFVILLNGINQPQNAGEVADRILAEISQPLNIGGHEIALSASIGISHGDANSDSAESLLRDADTAVYHAKAMGKSRWCEFDQTMRDQAVERLALETDLKKALERGDFRVFYQPIVELPSGRIEGFEALVRWQHATRGLIPPNQFIPIAEETGFIIELGGWVLEEACRQLRAWQLGYPEQLPLFVSVNVSSKQFSDPALVSRVSDCLKRAQLEPACLKIEITETAIMGAPEAAAEILSRLRKLGVQISLDDFGTGYSSLSYLQQFPIDTLKIDRSFINQIGKSNEAHEIVRTIISLAHSLNMNVTAEGIEELGQHSQLHDICCESGQGYLYSRPVPSSEAGALLNEVGALLKEKADQAETEPCTHFASLLAPQQMPFGLVPPQSVPNRVE